jgi:two-component system, chemotaxis family, protein-glutamate methylesterase/glutaminase
MPQSPALRRASQAAVAPIRVLIVDDSAVARAALSRMVADAPAFEVVAALDGARRAIDWLAGNSADIVLLDIQMPGLDGIAALPELVDASGGARVLIVSTLAGDGARATIQALSLGAADTLAKPEIGALGRQFGELLIDKMLRLGKARPAAIAEAREPHLLRKVAETPVACLAIGASTGGLHALSAFFACLPTDFDAPILITQHLPPVFMPFFADQLSALSGRTVRVAKGGATLKRGEILVAPGEAHLGLVRAGKAVKTVLLDQVAMSRCCPSVDPMFTSVGEVYGDGALGVVMTGMGRDGAIGAAAIADAGGTVIVQDAVSSAVWGMPGTVARAGLASLIAPPAGLAAYAARRGAAQ